MNHKIIISQAWLSTLILGKEIYTHSHAPTHPYIHAYTHTHTHTYVHIHTCLYIYTNTSIQKQMFFIYIYTYNIYKTYIYKFYLYIERNFFGFRTKAKTSNKQRSELHGFLHTHTCNINVTADRSPSRTPHSLVCPFSEYLLNTCSAPGTAVHVPRVPSLLGKELQIHNADEVRWC